MKSDIFTFLVILLFSHVAWGQQNANARIQKSNIEAQKVSYITAQLELTPQQAQDFWPLYNAYRSELQNLRKETKQSHNPKRDAERELSDAQLNEIIKAEFVFDRQKVDLDEKYFERYKTVLPVSKVADFYAAERDFKRELLKALKENRRR